MGSGQWSVVRIADTDGEVVSRSDIVQSTISEKRIVKREKKRGNACRLYSFATQTDNLSVALISLKSDSPLYTKGPPLSVNFYVSILSDFARQNPHHC